MSNLPIEPLLPEICDTLTAKQRLVLAAAPGAGKTTRVPLALAGLLKGFKNLDGKILLLEPRRIAARMAAKRMAQTLSEPVGQRIGLSTRVDRKVSGATKVEVITDGLFTRRLLADPELSGVSAVIFDEVHERGLNTDLGLALCLEAQSALRDDLMILAMSATLDTAKVASRIDAPIIESEGRQYPVETRYLGRTRDRIEDQIEKAVRKALRETNGSILVFLPGAGEIRRTAERLFDLPSDIIIAPLFGALSPKDQDLAISPAANGKRKIVLSTDIAESALTIDGVSTVIDSGLARVPEFDAHSGASKLVTVRASRANVDQRRGRAGRLGPGVCYRLWDEAETRGLTAEPSPEILNADLSGLLLSLAEWGERDPSALTWLDQPPTGRVEAARTSLMSFGAIDRDGALTIKGKTMAKLPLAPRFAALLVGAETPGETALAAEIAALCSEAGLGGNSPDLGERLARFRKDGGGRAKQMRALAKRWGGEAGPAGNPARLLAKGWPDQIAKRRVNGGTSYLMASGRAGEVDGASNIAKSDWIVAVDMIGTAKGARITLAAPIEASDVLAISPPKETERADFDPKTGHFKARRVKTIGAIVLSEQPLPAPSGEAAKQALLVHWRTCGFQQTGLEDTIATFLKRLASLADFQPDHWPEWTMGDLQNTVAEWLEPSLTKAKVPIAGEVINALKAKLGWPQAQQIDDLAPFSITLPSGREAKLNWLDERAPLLECKPQELYGATENPTVANGKLPVTLQMLSPGGKPVATTRNLPAFWKAGYLDMAKDMRGRYPKHDWPDDPSAAKPHAGMTKARLAKG